MGEDLDRGRVYLPEDLLAAHGVDRGLLSWSRSTGRRDRRITAALRAAEEMTRAVYRQAAPGLAMLDPVSRPCIRAAFALYGGSSTPSPTTGIRYCTVARWSPGADARPSPRTELPGSRPPGSPPAAVTAPPLWLRPLHAGTGRPRSPVDFLPCLKAGDSSGRPLALGRPRTAVVEAAVATSERPGLALARALASILRPLMRTAAGRLWRDDLAYAERHRHLREMGRSSD